MWNNSINCLLPTNIFTFPHNRQWQQYIYANVLWVFPVRHGKSLILLFAWNKKKIIIAYFESWKAWSTQSNETTSKKEEKVLSLPFCFSSAITHGKRRTRMRTLESISSRTWWSRTKSILNCEAREQLREAQRRLDQKSCLSDQVQKTDSVGCPSTPGFVDHESEWEKKNTR